MSKQYFIIETTGAFTPENPPKVGQEIWAIINPFDPPISFHWSAIYDRQLKYQDVLAAFKYFPSEKLAEASAKSYQTAAARGAKLIEDLECEFQERIILESIFNQSLTTR